MSSHPFAAAQSVLSTDAIRERLLPDYTIGDVVQCRLHIGGVNDVYVVEMQAGKKYVLKVYSFGWRSASQVRYELDLLAHLQRNRAAVSRPVPRRGGDLLFPIPAPEGERQAVLQSGRSTKTRRKAVCSVIRSPLCTTPQIVSLPQTAPNSSMKRSFSTRRLRWQSRSLHTARRTRGISRG